MKILVAEDDPVSRRLLELTLAKWGFDVVTARDGEEAWEEIQRAAGPSLAILDWMMPGLDGVEVCRRIRERQNARSVYVIMLTAKKESADIVAGLDAGADDYMTKPFNRQELKSRIDVGVRIVELQRSLASRVAELESALSRVKQLQGLLPICSYCKKIRDDTNYWQAVDSYIGSHSDVEFSHSICPDCYAQVVEPMLNKLED